MKKEIITIKLQNERQLLKTVSKIKKIKQMNYYNTYLAIRFLISALQEKFKSVLIFTRVFYYCFFTLKLTL